MPIIFIPFAGMFTCVAAIFLNKHKYFFTSRFILSIVPVLCSNTYGAFLTPAGQVPVIGLHVLSFSFMAVPFILFSYKEQIMVILTSAIGVLQLLFFNYINAICEISLDYKFATSPLVEFISVFISLICIVGSLLLLQYANKRAEENNQKLINEVESEKIKSEDSERELKQTLEEIQKVRNQEERRNWQINGLSEFSTLLRSEKEFAMICDQLLQKLVKYVNGNQASLFVVDEDNKQLELVSSYAYDRKKHLNKVIAFGEGLLGQCYLENESIYLSNIPEDYITITSGLGHANPTCILLVPIKNNLRTEGVIEMAFFRKLEGFEIEFVEKLGEIICSIITNSRTQEATKMLLEQSQQYANQLHSQEEEMRQNLEELEATQEEMIRKENKYLSEINELKSLNH